jgi:hypothetical protein
MNAEEILNLEPDVPIAPVKDNFMDRVFAYVDSITNSKINIMTDEHEERFYKKASFMILRALSYSPDLIHVVNRVNKFYDLPVRMQYEFLLNIIPAKSRRNKWPKKTRDDRVKYVCEYYGYNEKRAEQAMTILTEDQMSTIIKKIEKKDTEVWMSSGGTGSR